MKPRRCLERRCILFVARRQRALGRVLVCYALFAGVYFVGQLARAWLDGRL
ncbi:hypothetical protein ACMT1E_04430 [Sphingomonas flavalba]|uniref:hypothetical protein n=1 Tax=Sphingomonas flavalba TaxID=2559804 RepID=UPI0039DF6D05